MNRPVPRRGLTIRTKVLLVSALLLTIPYVGYQYVREMEDHLRAGLEDSVLAAAQAVAGALHDRPDLLSEDGARGANEGEIYAHPLPHEMQIDGYVGDWGAHLGELRSLGETEAPRRLAAQFVAGKHGQHLFLLVLVEDARLVYAGPSPSRVPSADHVSLITADAGERPRGYVFSTVAPGMVTPFVVADARRGTTRRAGARRELRVRAAWRETADGYLLEARFPLGLLGPGVALAVGDFHAPGQGPTGTLATPGWRSAARLLPLVLPSEAIEGLIKGLGRTPGRRLWVIDRQRRVLARGGSLERDSPPAPINPLFALILRPPADELFEQDPIVSHLYGAEVEAALAGRGTSRWRATPEPGTYVVSAAYPVWRGERVAGAVIAEETTLGIQTLRREALATLFGKTLIAFVLGALVLLVLATRISVRLRRLRDDTEGAIDPQGRVVGTLSGTGAGDEIGDLSRSFAALMERLRQYNQYLEQLARRLSHELRTPIAIVRSSLDALEMEPPGGDAAAYLSRARDGLGRLDTIITRMSEAARLEQALGEAELEEFDLRDVIGPAIDAYRGAWPGQRFDYARPGLACPMRGVPDLILQMLDKLITNALEFTRTDAPISVNLRREDGLLHLEVVNLGPALPEAMADELFDSMVSVRDASSKREPHLGLGLYIVRLIAEFHAGRASAVNLAHDSGVCFRVEMPALRGG